MSELNSINSVVIAMAHHISAARAKTITQGMEFKATPLTAEPGLDGSYTVLCLLTGKVVKLTLRVNFGLDIAKGLVAQLTGKTADQVTPDQASDVLKEFSNMFQGGIQKLLQDQNVKTGIGLPLVIPPNVPVPAIFKKTPFDAHWSMEYGPHKFNCALAINVVDPSGLFHLEVPNFAEAEASEGDVDFL